MGFKRPEVQILSPRPQKALQMLGLQGFFISAKNGDYGRLMLAIINAIINTPLYPVCYCPEAFVIGGLIIFCHGCISVPHKGRFIRIGADNVLEQV